MSEPWEYEQEAAEEQYHQRLYEELGPVWAEEHGFGAYQDFYEDAIREFTAERLQSYYIAHPDLAKPAIESLHYAESLLGSYPKAALVFAATAMELAIKVLLLKPIVFGLVHTEGLAVLITDLTTQHTGMERFQDLLTVILAEYGGVDLKTFRRDGSTKTLWQEIGDVQKARNAVVHRGEQVPEPTGNLAVAVASALLHNMFPQVLTKLDLHLHEPGGVCGTKHGVLVRVYFYPIPNTTPSIMGLAELDIDALHYENMPETVTGKLKADFSAEALAALHSAACVLPMCILNTLIQYDIRLVPESDAFTGTKAARRGE